MDTNNFNKQSKLTTGRDKRNMKKILKAWCVHDLFRGLQFREITIPTSSFFSIPRVFSTVFTSGSSLWFSAQVFGFSNPKVRHSLSCNGDFSFFISHFFDCVRILNPVFGDNCYMYIFFIFPLPEASLLLLVLILLLLVVFPFVIFMDHFPANTFWGDLVINFRSAIFLPVSFVVPE